MNIAEFVLIGIGLAMDAFAVSVTNGMCTKGKRLLGALSCGLVFGLFQGAMPSIGYALGMTFSGIIEKADHWIALALLGFIGVNMIIDSRKGDSEEKFYNISAGLLFIQGLATSVDALAVGVSFAALGANIVAAAGIIAAITFAISFAGFFIGSKAGDFLCGKAELAGGLILTAIGLKIFAEHMFFN